MGSSSSKHPERCNCLRPSLEEPIIVHNLPTSMLNSVRAACSRQVGASDRSFTAAPPLHSFPPMSQISFSVGSRGYIKMPSPSHSNGIPSAVQVCDSVRQIIENYINSFESPSEADIDPFRLEVHTLYTFLDLFEKVRSAREPRLDIEESHIADITHLLQRCQRTLADLHDSLRLAWHPATVGEGQQAAWDLKSSTFTVPRVYISFYTRTVEMSLMGIHL